MKRIIQKTVTTGTVIAILAGLYYVALEKHNIRTAHRDEPVRLTPGCEQKLNKYLLKAGDFYYSPYIEKQAKRRVLKTGYTEQDIRAIQRGCNIIDDTQGQHAKTDIERWYSDRYIRGTHTSCDHCHQGIGDKQNESGNRLIGSLSLAASWSNGGDTYDRFTGLLLPFELRQMQCFINSSNGYKPNIADDIVRDITAYSRFLSNAVGLQYHHRYPEQGIDEVAVSMTEKRGDDYVRGAALYKEKCSRCHGRDGRGTVINEHVVFPAVAGPNSFNRQSRNYFRFVSTILPGFICRNMPLGEEGSLSSQDCRDIAYYISNLPRPAGDKAGPLAAVWQQMMMFTMPKLIQLFNPEESSEND